jgi:FAD/FMN-containing dehydrogenase
VRAGEGEHADLLWALRGGGGNFGVATRLEFRLHPLDRVVGGRLVYAGPGVRDALRLLRDVVADAPRDLSCGAVLAVDDSLQLFLIVGPSYTGADGDPDWLRRLREAPGLVDDRVREHSYISQQHVFNSAYGEERHYWKNAFVPELPDELIDELLNRIQAMGRPPGQILFESLHGAPKENGDGPIGFRHAAFNVSATATWNDDTVDDEHIAWARETTEAMRPWSVSGGYANYMQADEPIERVRAAFGDQAFGRLQELKTRYDPGNVLRRNQNIPPLEAAADR